MEVKALGAYRRCKEMLWQQSKTPYPSGHNSSRQAINTILPPNYLCPMRPFSLLLFLLCLSCSVEQEEVNLRLTMAERDIVDSRVTVYMDSIRRVLDTLCTNTYEDQVAITTDSIVQRRLEEEARLRARIPENLRNDR